MSRLGSFALVLGLLALPACDKKEELTPEQVAEKRQNALEAAETRLRSAKYDDAAAIYISVLEEHPDDPEALGGLARVRYQESKYEDAEVLVKKSLAAKPDDPVHQTLLGDLYARSDRPAEAAEAYGKAFAADPEDATVGLSYGQALIRAGKFAEAQSVLEKVIDVDPQALTQEKVGVYTLLGDALRGQEKTDEALRTYMRAQNTYDSDKMARAGAALVYESKGDIKHALDEWSAYIQRDCCSEYSNNVAKKKVEELSKLEEAGIEQKAG